MTKRPFRAVLAVLACAAAAALAPAAVASGATATATQPTLSLVRDCEFFPGKNSVIVTLTGLPPFTSFEFTMEVPTDLTVGPAVEQTDASGSWEPGFRLGSPLPGTWTVTVVWSGGQLMESLYVDCSRPGSKEDCKDGGWNRWTQFGFTNQGQCIALVSGGKSTPVLG